MKIIIFLLLSFNFALSLSAATNNVVPAKNSDFNKGLKSLEANDYSKAVTYFSNKKYSHNGAALLNLGIAYSKLDETTLAVGHFRKARAFSTLFSPASKQASLWLKKMGFSSHFFTGYPAFFYEISRISWTYFYCLFVILFLLLLLALYKRKTVVPVIISFLILFSASINKIYYNQQIFGTLKGKLIELKSAPSTESSTINEAVQGDIVKVLSSNNNWFAVELADQRQGWLPKDYIIFH